MPKDKPSARARRNSKGSKAVNAPRKEEPEPCPSCPAGQLPHVSDPNVLGEFVGCEKCLAWHHWVCVSPADVPIETCLKWYCQECLQQASSSSQPLQIEWRDAQNTRRSSRGTTISATALNYANLDQGFASDPTRFHKIAQSKPITPHNFRKMHGKDLTAEWLWSDPSAMTEPIIIESPEGLDLKVPRDITVTGVADTVGHEFPVEVIDVASQSDLAHWNMGNFAKYYNSAGRSKVRNVISLEVSNTPLGSQIVPPRAIRDMDWIENIWPSKLKKQGYYPQVQRYCLMSVENCWTDWHVDFAASSVWYFICRGGKTFYFIRPTQENLKAYEQWSSSSERQENTWLGDHVDAVYQVELEAGNTMIIPSGWIHAVFTPQDSLVFGGNFLHSLNISTQLELYRVEVQTKVPRKFRFPHFITFLWFVTKHYYDRLLPLSPQSKARSQSEQKMEPLPPERLPQDVPLRVLRGLKALSFFMLGQARRLDKTLDESEFTDSQRKIARENWPKEQIKNPIELARVFRTLILRILGDTEDLPPPVPTLSQVDALPKTNKNKRKSTDYQPYRASSHRPKSYVAPLVIDPESRQNSREETTYEVLPRPLSKDEPDSGPEELAEVRTLHYVTEATRTVFGQERVIREVRTKTEHVRRIIWTGKPPPNTHVDPLEDTEMLPSNAQSSRTPTESEDVMEQQENKGLSPQHDLLDILATQSAQLDGRSKASAPIADAIEDSNTHSSSQKDPAQEISAVDAQDIKSEPVPSSATN